MWVGSKHALALLAAHRKLNKNLIPFVQLFGMAYFIFEWDDVTAVFREK